MSNERRLALVGTTDAITSTPLVPASSSTIPLGGQSGVRVAPTGNVTGIILQKGTFPLQRRIILNESAFSLTMAAAGTSNVADGTSCVIAANTQKTFYWNSATALWYHS